MRNDTQVAFRRRSQMMDFPHVPSDPARAELPAALPVECPRLRYVPKIMKTISASPSASRKSLG